MTKTKDSEPRDIKNPVEGFAWSAEFLRSYEGREVMVPYWDESIDDEYEPFVNALRCQVRGVETTPGPQGLAIRLTLADLEFDEESANCPEGYNGVFAITRSYQPTEVYLDAPHGFEHWVYDDSSGVDMLSLRFLPTKNLTYRPTYEAPTDVPGFEWSAEYLQRYVGRHLMAPYWDEPEDGDYEGFVNTLWCEVLAVEVALTHIGDMAVTFKLRDLEFDPDIFNDRSPDDNDGVFTLTRTRRPDSVTVERKSHEHWNYGTREPNDMLSFYFLEAEASAS